MVIYYYKQCMWFYKQLYSRSPQNYEAYMQKLRRRSQAGGSLVAAVARDRVPRDRVPRAVRHYRTRLRPHSLPLLIPPRPLRPFSLPLVTIYIHSINSGKEWGQVNGERGIEETPAGSVPRGGVPHGAQARVP